MTAHLVLLGDSIFDNAAYVPGGWPVIRLLQAQLPENAQASLLAVDGSVTRQVITQLQRVPAGATHLILSSGGNDALMAAGIAGTRVSTVNEALRELAVIRADFRENYRCLLQTAKASGRPTLVCTIYTAIPDLTPELGVTLALFNDVIVDEAHRAAFPVLDLRQLCDEAGDYSEVSSIEPSEAGGQKIASAIIERIFGKITAPAIECQTPQG